MKGQHFIIDIGHADGTGARGNGKEEHALCTVIGKHLAAALEKAGHTVTKIDFPADTNRDDLNKTIAAANRLPGIACGISLHMDCSDNAAAHGAHVCYYSSTGARIAQHVAASLCRLIPGRANATVQRPDLAVLRRTAAPWILCECGFISHYSDCNLAVESPHEIAAAISKGLLAYFS